MGGLIGEARHGENYSATMRYLAAGGKLDHLEAGGDIPRLVSMGE